MTYVIFPINNIHEKISRLQVAKTPKRSAILFQIALYAVQHSSVVQINKTRAETGNELEIQHGVGH